ncbi:MAG: lipopolysaccharide biosynthesis protein [Promethearchaeota archaeon]
MLNVQKKVAESSSFFLLTVYLTFFFSILNTFVLARLLAPEEWALLILTIAFINIAIFFSNLFPPNAQDTIMYYIPHLSSKGSEYAIKRSFIIHVYKIRLFSGFLIFLFYLFIANLAGFNPVLFEMILITSPMILCKIIIDLNDSVLYAFQKFKSVFIARVINPITITIFNFIIFFYKIKNPIFFISFAFLLGTIVSCIMSIVLIIKLISFRIKKDLLPLNQKSEFYSVHKKYGINLILADIFGLLTGLIINLLFLEFEFIIFITYITICQISVTSALLFASSNPEAYISIFSEIDYEKNSEKYLQNFYKLNKFLMMFVCIIVGIMLFYIEFYIVVIYSPTYLILLAPLRLFLFTTFALVIVNNLMIITLSTNNTKINAEINFIRMAINILFTLIALLFFDFYILIIFYLISSYLMTFIAVYLINKQTSLKFRFVMFFQPFIIFIVSFLIVYPLNYIVNITTFDKAYINFFINGTIKFTIFALVFYILFYFTKTITKEEFNDMIKIIPILNSKNFLIKKIVKKIEFFLPSEQNE